MKTYGFRLCALILALTILLASIAVAEDSVLVPDNAALDERPLDGNDLAIDDSIASWDDLTVSMQPSDIDLQLGDFPLEGAMAAVDEAAEGPEAVNASIPKALTLGVKEKYALKAKKASYDSSKPTVASVSKSGVITAKRPRRNAQAGWTGARNTNQANEVCCLCSESQRSRASRTGEA